MSSFGQVGAEAVARCERGRLTLRPGAELAAGRVSEGLLGLAIDKARVRTQTSAIKRAHTACWACPVCVCALRHSAVTRWRLCS